MPSGVQKQAGNRYDCVYEQPWGGVSSEADPSDISANEFAQGDGIFIKNGRINAAGWGNTTGYNFALASGITYVSGDNIDFTTSIYQQSTDQWGTYAFSAFTKNAYRYDTVVGHWVVDQTLAFGAIGFDCFQVIAGVVYIFDFQAGKMYVYTPNTSFVVGQSFVAGKYCCVIKGYLLTAYTNQPTDTPAIKTNRYNWSSPYGYTTWDPSVDRTSGFNTLTSVSDQITNIFAMGNVGYILRTQGLSQLTPNGIGIGPFDEDDLWESEFGVGCTYPNTFSQYGNVAAWANDNNIYAFTTGGVPQGITGRAKAAIYADINKYESDGTVKSYVNGSFSNVSELSKKPELTYTLSIIHAGTSSGGRTQIIESLIWTYNLNDKIWTRQTPDFDFQITNLSGIGSANYTVESIKSQGTYQFPITTGVTGIASVPKRIRNNIIINILSGSTRYSFMMSFYYSENGAASGNPAVQPISIQLKQEEFRLLTQPTVRGIGIKLNGIGTLNINVIGQDANNNPVNYQFGPLTLSAVNRFIVQLKLTKICSLQNPQIIITSTNWDGSIVKMRMYTTFDEGEVV
jgi:hypothetical protein